MGGWVPERVMVGGVPGGSVLRVPANQIWGVTLENLVLKTMFLLQDPLEMTAATVMSTANTRGGVGGFLRAEHCAETSHMFSILRARLWGGHCRVSTVQIRKLRLRDTSFPARVHWVSGQWNLNSTQAVWCRPWAPGRLPCSQAMLSACSLARSVGLSHPLMWPLQGPWHPALPAECQRTQRSPEGS